MIRQKYSLTACILRIVACILTALCAIFSGDYALRLTYEPSTFLVLLGACWFMLSVIACLAVFRWCKPVSALRTMLEQEFFTEESPKPLEVVVDPLTETSNKEESKDA